MESDYIKLIEECSACAIKCVMAADDTIPYIDFLDKYGTCRDACAHHVVHAQDPRAVDVTNRVIRDIDSIVCLSLPVEAYLDYRQMVNDID